MSFRPRLIAFALLCSLPGVRADVITFWNSEALSAIRNESIAPPLASRNLAILHVAIHDAVNSIMPTHHAYRANVVPALPVSGEAAAAGAAYRVLVNLFPSQVAAFDSARTASLSGLPVNEARTNGWHLGETVADAVLESRSADGSSTDVPYIPSTDPGAWRRTPPFFRPPDSPQWRYVTPFALLSAWQFRPPGPPPLASEQYADEVEQVRSLGANNSTTRTEEQTLVARFWSDFSYTVTPPGHWNQIAQNVATNHSFTLQQTARLFALLNIALADAAIAVWDAKYVFNFWRPVTAIQQADSDGNAATIGDPGWMPLLNTPAFPEYVSGHSAFSAAAATVLGSFLGTDMVPFTVVSDSVPGVVRSYSSFIAAADEIALSRIYGGIHFLAADLDGLELGHRIGEYVDRHLLLPLGAPAITVNREWPDGMSITVHDPAGTGFLLQTSTNLVHWTTIGTNQTPWSTMEPVTEMFRYFRVRPLR